MTRKNVIKIVISLLLLWIGFFVIDWFAVACLESSPVFCIKNEDETHFNGFGYCYDTYSHPISEKFEYSLYIFGFEAKSTFTNEVSQMKK